MSASLLKLSSGPLVTYSFLRVVNGRSSINLRIMSAKGGHKNRHGAVTNYFAESALSFEYASRAPTQHHGSALPASHPSSDLADSTEEVLNQVGG